MKAIKYLLSLTLLLGSLVSCDSDLDKITVNSDQAEVSTLKADNTTVVMEAKKREEVAVKLTWGKTDYKAPVAPTYVLEVDLAGKSFKNKVIMASTTDLSASLIGKDLNGYMTKLQKTYASEITNPVAPMNVEVRLAVSFSEASKTLYSSVLAMEITPFLDEAPKIYIVGDYCGWNHGNAQYLYSADYSDIYRGLIFFDGKAANGWKICSQGDWGGTNWGSGTMDPDATSTLDPDGGAGNITAFTKVWYEFQYNTATAELTVVKSYDQWALIGSFNGWGGDAPMTLARDDKGAYMTATLDFEAGTQFKLRADADWANNIGAGQIAKGSGYTGTDNFEIAEAGNYTIKWYFNKTEQELHVVKN